VAATIVGINLLEVRWTLDWTQPFFKEGSELAAH
jgi:hypothetical protein